MSDEFDVVILGGGPGGYAAALRASQLDLSVALVEKDKLGGTCLHRGCIPTKALLHAGEIADAARESAQFGIKTELVGVDMPGVNSYKDGVVSRGYKGLQGLIKAAKQITTIEGKGRLVARDTVEVDGRRLTGRHVVLATGSYSRTLPGLEVDGERVLTSEQALTLDRVPRSVVVLGGGIIGSEFASVWRSLGAEVTIIEALPRLLASEDEDSSKQVQRAFRRRGITFKPEQPFERVEYTDDGVRVTAGGNTYDAEVLLVAVGRGPVTDGLGYDEQGITLERGFVRTDERLRTNVPGVFAVGDIVPGPQLAHRGFQQGVFVAEEIAGRAPAVIDEDGIPRVTYCEPEVASVGLTEAAARERYGDDNVATYTYNLGGNLKSGILKTQGFTKLIRLKDGPVIGLHLVGSRVSELVSEAQLIYNWEAYPADVAPLIHAHPTQSEALGEAHLALAGKPLHVHD